MRRVAVAALMLLTAATARAEPAIDAQNHYLALQVTVGDVGKDLVALIAQARAATESDERLKWLLDHPEWLGAPTRAK